MKSIPVLLLLMVTSLSGWSQSSKLQKFAWLEGTWQNPSNGVMETWRWDEKGEAWKGKGFEVYEGDTLVIETLAIRLEKGKPVYVATVPENKAPVIFKMAKVEPTGFKCTNFKHDFPRVIEYQSIDAHQMKATVGDGKKSKDFLFRRVK
jgi:hypothetical protein